MSVMRINGQQGKVFSNSTLPCYPLRKWRAANMQQYTKTKEDEERAIDEAIEGDYASFNARVLGDRALVKLRRDAEQAGRWKLREILLEEESRRLQV